MSRQVSPSTGHVYGLQRVTRVWGMSRATVYRHRRWSEAVVRKRPGPLGAMADEDLAGEISRLPKGSSFMARATATCGPGCALPASAQSAPGPAAHARARPAGASACQVSLTRPPRWHDHHRAGRCDVGRRPDLGDDRRGPGRGSSRSTTARPSALVSTPATAPIASRRSSRSGRRCASASVPSPRTSLPASSCATSWQSVRKSRLPDREPLPRHHKLTRLRPRARGQRLRGMVHPGAKGEPALGSPLRDRRGCQATGETGLGAT